ncbi:putative manganese transporter, partial [Actinoalloteichus spitiensis]|uniref:putative manganese transporter n=1 Tax=Actinoalloteichus spitiensis TaxID=252394 RepID=UPI0005858EC6
MEDLLLVPLADAFMQVGVFVFLLVGLAGLVRGPVSRRLVAPLGRRRSGPVLGALLGVAPGCAGALMLVPLFRRGRVGYGT